MGVKVLTHHIAKQREVIMNLDSQTVVAQRARNDGTCHDRWKIPYINQGCYYTVIIPTTICCGYVLGYDTARGVCPED